MAFRVIRTPGMDRRMARNMDRLTNTQTVTAAGGAIQEDTSGSIVLVTAPGEPFSQSDTGLVFVVASAGGLEKVSSALQIKIGDSTYLRTTTSGLDWTTRRKEQLSHAVNEPMLTPVDAALTQVAIEQAAEEAIVNSATLSWMGY